MKKRIKWLLPLIVLLAVGAGFVIYSLVSHGGASELTVSEFLSQAESLQNQQLKIKGRVAPGSIDWDESSKVMKFVLADDKGSLGVVYQGIAPDNFKPGASLTVVGRYQSDGGFEAQGFSSGSAFCQVCHD